MLYRPSIAIQKEELTGLTLGREKVSGKNQKVSDRFELLKL
jgi:hypothetical protein